VLTLIKTDLPFSIFKTHHFQPTQRELVITQADSNQRLVTEINGGPPALEYAKLAGIDATELKTEHFTQNPLMLEIGKEWYVRSVLEVCPDQSLRFYCAIGEGLPLSIGESQDIADNLKTQLNKVTQTFDRVDFILGCECLFRRIEIQQKDKFTEVEKILGDYQFVGFSTFGEQYKGVHINHTLTAVVVGQRSA